VREIPEIIREVIAAVPLTRFDRAHFREFGDSALLFEAVYYVLDPDYNRYMDIQQQVNLGLMERFSAQGIEFAYPTQTVFLAGGESVLGPSRDAAATPSRSSSAPLASR
jgi:small-conductance mechanosensitive channel